MNKEMFLEELRGYLQVLEDQEQDDILEEYAQHIDMKLLKGLSEEEAIKDFGPVKELAAEILEAYHVKPDFQEKKAAIKLPGLGGRAAGSGKNFFMRICRLFREKLKAAADGIKKGWRWSAGKCRDLGKRLGFGKRNAVENGNAFGKGNTFKEQYPYGEEAGSPFGNGEEETAALSVLEKPEQEEQRGKHTRGGRLKMKNIFRATGRGIAALWRMFLAFCIFWLRFCWNAAWLAFSIFCGIMAMIVLMGVGTMLVFLLKGYPIFGLFTICVGGLLCLGAMCAGAFGMIIRRKKAEQDTEGINGRPGGPSGEVQYE